MTPARSKAAQHEPPMERSVLRLSGDVTDLGSLPGAWVRNRLDHPRVVAFDVGKVTGWAILGPPGEPPRLGHFAGGDITGDFATMVRGVLFRAIGDRSEPVLVAVEDVFVHRAAPNLAVSLHLARQVGAICGICAGHAPVVRVLATQWQSALLGKIRRDQGKKLSVEVARQRISRDITSDHVADAALLALYVRGA